MYFNSIAELVEVVPHPYKTAVSAVAMIMSKPRKIELLNDVNSVVAAIEHDDFEPLRVVCDKYHIDYETFKGKLIEFATKLHAEQPTAEIPDKVR